MPCPSTTTVWINATPANLDTWDLVVAGSTIGGMFAAIAAARQGLRCLLLSEGPHVGGMLTSGIQILDEQYEGRRAPLYGEWIERLLTWYRERYGADSPRYAAVQRVARSSSSGRIRFESHAAEAVCEAMLAGTPGVTLWRGWHVTGVMRDERRIQAVRVANEAETEFRLVSGRGFVDGTYEGDLAAHAGAPTRVGREDRNEFDEPHAGRMFIHANIDPRGAGLYPRDAAEGRLDLRPFRAVSGEVYAGSTGEGDDGVQTYHYRLTLSSDPANQVLLTEPPPGYDPEFYRRIYEYAPIPTLRNQSPLTLTGMWAQNPLLLGLVDEYPRSTWAQRQELLLKYRHLTVGALWFLQHDETIPEAARAINLTVGFAADEYLDNGHFPPVIYVREARRLDGRAIFTEHDGSLARGYGRTPVRPNSIGITDWFMDSHAVSGEVNSSKVEEGKLLLTELSRPGQIDWGCMLDRQLDNLIVAVCISSTHVGWGAIRLEPVWMQLGEVAGRAAALAQRSGVTAGTLCPQLLTRHLLDAGVQTAFFNDIDLDASWSPAVQYFAGRGFFADYEIRPDAPLSLATAARWARFVGALVAGRHDADAAAREMGSLARETGSAPGVPGTAEAAITSGDFRRRILAALTAWDADASSVAVAVAAWPDDATPLPRSVACQRLYDALA